MSASPKFEGMKLQRDLARANVEQLRAERDAALARANAWETDWGVERARAEKAEAALEQASVNVTALMLADLGDELASAQAEVAQLGVLLQGAQAEILSMEAVIDAAQENEIGCWTPVMEIADEAGHVVERECGDCKGCDFHAALAAHLDKYGTKDA